MAGSFLLSLKKISLLYLSPLLKSQPKQDLYSLFFIFDKNAASLLAAFYLTFHAFRNCS